MDASLWPRAKVVAIVAVIVATVFVAVGLYQGPPSGNGPRQLTAPERDCGLLLHFSSLEELKAHLRAHPSFPVTDLLAGAMGGGTSSRATEPYSGTNNQVAGVDEADVVKTDGVNVYTLSARTDAPGVMVDIVRAYPPDAAAVVGRIAVDGWVQGLFVHGDRLAVLSGGGFAYILGGSLRDVPWFFRPQTSLLVYDISRPAVPLLVKNVTVSGSYVGARMIGGVAYVIVQDYLFVLQNDTLMLPTIWTDRVPRALTYADIGYFADSGGYVAATTVLAFNITSLEAPAFESFLTHGVYTLYMSATNLYLAGVTWETRPDGRVVTETSTIHKVHAAGEHVSYECSVRVPGTILNQFSMDEGPGGVLRVATTLGQWTPSGSSTSAAVFTFEASLTPLGHLTGLAPGERIYSARFLGPRVYLVTFRQIDPLFVIDLGDPAAPRVLGYLKIHGVADYLHPYGGTHLIGVGRADPSGTGRLHGIKLSLYDVSDVERPAEVAKFVIGGAEGEWAWSEAIYDHKAFLFIPGKNLIVIPVSLTRWTANTSTTGYWQGAYVVAVTPGFGFELRGTITHATASKTVYGYEVRRSLFIGAYLYTVSNALMLANRLDTLAEVARVAL